MLQRLNSRDSRTELTQNSTIKEKEGNRTFIIFSPFSCLPCVLFLPLILILDDNLLSRLSDLTACFLCLVFLFRVYSHVESRERERNELKEQARHVHEQARLELEDKSLLSLQTGIKQEKKIKWKRKRDRPTGNKMMTSHIKRGRKRQLETRERTGNEVPLETRQENESRKQTKRKIR